MIGIGRIEIPKRGTVCYQCTFPFSPGKTLVSRLFLGDKGGIVRFDCCPLCHENVPAQNKELSCWKTVVPYEQKALSPKQKGDAAKELFESLFKEERAEPSKLYLLALYLERRRIFARRGELKEEGQDMILFESVRSGDVYSVPNVGVNEIAFDEIGEDLKNIL